jgi:hypothetical protein
MPESDLLLGAVYYAHVCKYHQMGITVISFIFRKQPDTREFRWAGRVGPSRHDVIKM